MQVHIVENDGEKQHFDAVASATYSEITDCFVVTYGEGKTFTIRMGQISELTITPR